MSRTIAYPAAHEPCVFTTAMLGWLPWIVPLAEADLTERHFEGLVDRPRAKSDYFRLLARDPDVLGARTRADKDIFYSKGGLPRHERELAATAVSRLNGCIYCASVHARFSIQFSKTETTISSLLDTGTVAQAPARDRAIVDAAFALTRSPLGFDDSHLNALEEAGLDDAQIIDLIQSAAFFNWANRLMLSLGQADVSGA